MAEAFRRIVYPDGRVHDIKPTIDVTHAYIHTGIVSYFNFTNKSVSNGANLDLVFINSGNYEIHFILSVMATGLAYVSIGEGVQFTGGTPVTPYCLNRDHPLTPVYSLVHTPTISDVGTLLVNERLLPGGNTAATRVGAGVRDNTEWVLAEQTSYLFRMNNASSQAQPMCIEGIAYYKED